MTLEQGLGKDFNPETKKSWEIVYSTISTVMMADHYDAKEANKDEK